MRAPIVLLTDYGVKDPYAGVLHGVIASRAPRTSVIDLTHGIEAQNIRQASLYLEDSFRYFPKGSIFVCIVDPGVGTDRAILCVKSKSYYFIAPDNGLLTDLSRKEPFVEIRTLVNEKYFLSTASSTFHGRDLFAPAACALANQASNFKKFGPAVKRIVLLQPLPIIKTKRTLQGEVVYFDHFGNAITNLSRRDASDAFWNSAIVQAGLKKLGSIHETYGGEKSPRALWNSSNRLEIAIPGGRASSFLKTSSPIKVTCEK